MQIKNWRPISLINIDIKIAFKALALRTKRVPASIIHYDQTAYVKGKYIGESVTIFLSLLRKKILMESFLLRT